MEDGEKKDKAKAEEQSEFLESKEGPRRKRRRGQKKEAPEAFMANFLVGLEIYQTKMLVRHELAYSGRDQNASVSFKRAKTCVWNL